MSYEHKWKTLSDLLIQIQKMGEKIPSTVMNDLRSAKTLIQVLKRDPTHTESLTRVEVYLKNVEVHTVSVAEKKGTEMVQDWLNKINQPETKEPEKPKEATVNPKVSRYKKWIRIKPIEELSLESVQKLSETTGVTVNVDENGDIFVFGDENDVKSFAKNIAKQLRGSKSN